MTKNQIEYGKLLETRRANVRQEELTASRDMEVKRHNYATEGLQKQSLDETVRSNLAKEYEANRANLAREKETNRSNLAQEALTSARDAETRRSNLVNESLKSATLQEQIRSNQASEALRSREIDIKGATLGETIRANKAREAETYRSNVAREIETTRSNVAREDETNRANVAREEETARHNKFQEGLDVARNATYAADVAGRLIYYNKDHSSNVIVTPYQNNQSVPNTGDKGLGNSGTNPVNPKTPSNPNVPNRSTGTKTNGGNNNGKAQEQQVGRTFWDVALELNQRAQNQLTFTQGGTLGGGTGRSNLRERSAGT